MSYVEEAGADHPALDDDGRPRRTGMYIICVTLNTHLSIQQI